MSVVKAKKRSSITISTKRNTRAQRRRQLQEMEQGEVEATPSSNSLQDTEDLEVEEEGVDDPLLARGPVSEYPDPQEGGNGPVSSSGSHPPKTPSKDPRAHALAALQANSEQLRDWQQTDLTLQKIRELASAGAEEKSGGATFFYRGGLIYRRWSPKNRDTLSWDQLVLPQQCRQLVLNIAHDLPTAGHLGTNKTRGRILKCYYWPGVFRQVADYCTTCEICQKSLFTTRARGRWQLWQSDKAMLSQVGEDGGENPIAYASRKPKLKRACYPTIEMQDKNADGLSRGGRDVTESLSHSPGQTVQL